MPVYIDVLPIAIYVGLVVWITWGYGRQKAEGPTYFLAGRNQSSGILALSILATETSGASLLVFPNLGFNPEYRFLFVQMLAGFVIGRILLAVFLVPAVYNSNEFTIYQYFGRVAGPSFSKLSAGFYVLASFLSDGVRLFMACLGLWMLYGGQTGYEFGWLPAIIIIIAGVGATIYAAMSGLRGVLVTDRLQILLVLGAVFYLTIWGIGQADFSWPVLASTDFFQLPATFSDWIEQTYRIPLAFVGGILLTLGSHGANQTLFQRVLAAGSPRAAGRALIFSAIGIVPLICIFIFCGFVLSGVASVADAVSLKDGGQVIPAVGALLQGWLRPILAVAFLAAAMSSIDSSLHSLTTALRSAGWFTEGATRRLAFICGGGLTLSALVFALIKSAYPNSPLIGLALGAVSIVFCPLAGVMAGLLFIKPVPAGPAHLRHVGARPLMGWALVGGVAVSVSLFFYNLLRSEESLSASWAWGVIASFLTGLFLSRLLAGNAIGPGSGD